MVETALLSVKGVVVARVSLRKHAAIVLVDTRLRYQPPRPPVVPNT
jgi:copper chaperone CopZ